MAHIIFSPPGKSPSFVISPQGKFPSFVEEFPLVFRAYPQENQLESPWLSLQTYHTHDINFPPDPFIFLDYAWP